MVLLLSVVTAVHAAPPAKGTKPAKTTAKPAKAPPPAAPLPAPASKPAAAGKPCADVPLVEQQVAPTNAPFEEAKTMFMNFQFEEAIPKLQQALTVATLESEKVEIYKLLAFTYTSLDQPDEAQQTFIKVLELQEDTKLTSGTSPKMLSALAEAERTFRARKPVKLSHEPPQAQTGKSITVDAVAVEGSDRVQALTLHYRLRGPMAPAYLQMEMSKGDNGAFSARVPTEFPGPAGRKTIEYFIRARERNGALVANVGDETTPYSLVVETTELVPPTPLYKNWLFWGVVGSLAAGGVTAYTLSTQRPVEAQAGTLGHERL